MVIRTGAQMTLLRKISVRCGHAGPSNCHKSLSVVAPFGSAKIGDKTCDANQRDLASVPIDVLDTVTSSVDTICDRDHSDDDQA